MPILKPQDLTPEEERHETIAKQIVGSTCNIAGAVRGMTPLVMAALQLANNPYVTGLRGFAAMGLEEMGIYFEEIEGKQVVNDPAGFGIVMMQKSAEFLVLVTCENVQLKQFAVDAQELQSASLDYMEVASFEDIAAATVKISELLVNSGKSRVSRAPEDKEAPKAATIGEGGHGPKKRVRTGSRKS